MTNKLTKTIRQAEESAYHIMCDSERGYPRSEVERRIVLAILESQADHFPEVRVWSDDFGPMLHQEVLRRRVALMK